MLTAYIIFFFIIKPTRYINFTNLFWHETLHVSDSSSVNHQEFELAEDRDKWPELVNALMNLRLPQTAGNYLTGCKPVSFSRRTLFHGLRK